MWTLLLWACGPSDAELDAAAAEALTWTPAGLRDEVWRDAVTAWRCAGTGASTLAVVDFSRPSDERRLWIVDVEAGEAARHLRVTHGSGSGGRWATRFSNREGSHQSSLGLYRGGAPYHGKHGRSLRLDGLEPGNHAARERAIVVHGASYASDAYVAEHGQLGRSWGCFAVDPGASDAVVDALRGGGLLLAWHPDWREETSLLGCATRTDVAFPEHPLYRGPTEGR
jgi:hypothetical protein